MHSCAYCGRRLLWLHRVVDGKRYCSREHARLHQTAIEQAARKLIESHAPAGTALGESLPGPEEPAGLPEPSGPAPFWIAFEEPAPLPYSDHLLHLEAPPAEAGPSSPSHAPHAEPILDGAPVIRAVVIPDREPTAPAPPAGPLVYAPAPVARRAPPSLAVRPLRPRRTIFAPAHRPGAPAARLREARAAIPGAWSAPVGSLSGTGAEPHESNPLRGSSQAPGAVLVFSFLDGLPGVQPSGASPQAARPQSSGWIRAVPAEPAEWPLPAPGPSPQFCLTGRHRQLPRLLLRPFRGQPPCFRPRRITAAPFEAVAAQAASVQPFRLHRMPLRPLQLRPLAAGAAFPPVRLAALNRLPFLNALYVPRAASRPFRPGYRWLPPPANLSGSPQPHADLASHAAGRRQGV